MKTICLIISTILFMNFHVIAQETNVKNNTNISIVSGKIIDVNGLPLIGAKISAKGIANKTTTDFDGKFTLHIDYETILYINFIGFKPIEVLVKPQTNINLLLSENKPEAEVTQVTRKEMLKTHRANKKNSYNKGSGIVETLFYTIQAIAE